MSDYDTIKEQYAEIQKLRDSLALSIGRSADNCADALRGHREKRRWKAKAREMAAEARRWRREAEVLQTYADSCTKRFGRYRGALREAVNASCTCGGAGPGEGCPACEVWHWMRGTK